MATLVVPNGAKSTYQDTSGWSFSNISEASEQKVWTVNVATAGAMRSLIPEIEKCYIEDLTVTGKLNGYDLGFLCEMAGKRCYWGRNGSQIYNNSLLGNLSKLDISGAEIVAGGNYYVEEISISDRDILSLNKDNELPRNIFAGCSHLTAISIPKSVTSIGYEAFYCCGLTSVTIPSSVTNIGGAAFGGCNGLVSIEVENDNLYFDSRNNCNAIIETSSNTLIAFCKKTTIPSSVISIGNYAFSGYSSLTSFTIPNSVTSIGEWAFYRCSGLTSITIPNSVTSIGDHAFYGCSGLTSIVSLNSNPPSLQNSYVFDNVDKNNCVVWVPKGSLSAYKGAYEWKEFTNIFELVEGDLNLDDVVDQNDMDALVGFVMGENPEGFYEGLADLNGDNKVDAADVVKMVDLLSASSGLGADCQLDFENVNGNLVVSSLSCTLNNERSEAIQLTKCELYCNHNLVSSKNFSGASASVQAGGSKECTFNNLAKLNSSTGFIVCWHYTASGKNFVYRCPLKD